VGGKKERWGEVIPQVKGRKERRVSSVRAGVSKAEGRTSKVRGEGGCGGLWLS
jgi:hypothetical protein